MIAHVNTTSLTMVHFISEWPEPKLTVAVKTGELAAEDLVPVKAKTDLLVSGTRQGKQVLVFGSKRIAGPSMDAFAALPPDHESRVDKLGSYDQQWIDERWPYYPTDFDIAYFNCAPASLQIDQPQGDENIGFDDVALSLPALRVRAFLVIDDALEELELSLDTVALDVDARELHTTWRGFTETTEPSHIYLAAEPLADDPLSIEHHEQKFHLATLEKPQVQRRPLRRKANDNEPPDDAEELAALRQSMVDINAPADILADIDKASTLEQAMGSMLDKLEGDPAEIDKLLKETNARMKKQLEDAGQDGSAFDMDEEIDDAPVWTRKRVEDCAKNGESMAGVELRKLDLSELDLKGVQLHDARLRDVNLKNTILYGADLSGATLQRCDLSGAVLGEATLVDADLTGAEAMKIDLRSANLAGAVLDQAKMKSALLDDAKAAGASFYEADLSNASFLRADLSNARVDATIIHGVSFEDATLTDAALDSARGDDVSFLRANMFRTRVGEAALLYRADLRHAKADESIWFGADLREAKLTLSELRRADFSGANLEEALLDGANCADADFTEGNLAGASMLGANFAGARFTKASLERADARKANFYEAELWQTKTKGTRFDEAHLAMTKLAPEESAS